MRDGTISRRPSIRNQQASHGPASGGPRLKYFSARAKRSYLEADYAPGDFLVFGSETKGLGEEFLRTRTEATYRIPIFEPGVRSLNLANAVSIVLYEALRQSRTAYRVAAGRPGARMPVSTQMSSRVCAAGTYRDHRGQVPGRA